MDWRLFATKLETADTSEVTVLNNYAPPLYSAVKSRYILAGCSNPGMLLTLQVSLPPVNSTVKLDSLVRTDAGIQDVFTPNRRFAELMCQVVILLLGVL